MKRLLAILMICAMMLSFAGCAFLPEEPVGEEQEEQKVGQNADPNLESDLEALDSALDVLEALTPEGWDENDYGAYIYGEWDEDFLPELFPSPAEGIEIDQTHFKDYGHKVMNDNFSVGSLTYESAEEYREYSVSFYATKAQLDSIVKDALSKGFKGGAVTNEDDVWWEYDFYHDDGWYMYFFVNTNAAKDDYIGFITVSLTDSVFEHPKSIDGIPLPQTGLPYGSCENYTIQDFSEGYEDVDFDLDSDSLPEEYYAAWFSYICADVQTAKDYVQLLVSEGWTVEYESESEGSYYSALKKDGMYAVSNFYAYDLCHEVGFSDMIENLQY